MEYGVYGGIWWSKKWLDTLLAGVSFHDLEVALKYVARAINHKFRSKDDFTEEQYAHIKHMVELCNTALDYMIEVEEGKPGADYNRSRNVENEINNYCKQLKERNVADINDKKYDYQMSVHYMDVVNACEHLGDYVINVVEAHVNKKKLTA